MPELRTDPLTGTTVIVAPERAARPDAFRVSHAPPPHEAPGCAFCPGNESMTPPEVARTGGGEPDAPGWRVRVVPNLYPIVAAAPSGVTGAHEVVVLSPAHDRDLARLAPDHAREALRVLRDRARTHAAAGRAHVQVFVNHGRAAGASIEHPHAQVVALDIVPPAVADALARADGRDLVDESRRAADDAGLVVLDGAVSAWCPAASASPFETVVAHHAAGAHFHEAGDDVLDAVTDALHGLLRRVHATLGDVAYNVVVHSAGPAVAVPFRWHARVIPRVSVVAGFEEGTGIRVDAVAPEVAAAALRDADVGS
jgi:UDPglucose--hexose-1-phosphate uridylyltransferase